MGDFRKEYIQQRKQSKLKLKNVQENWQEKRWNISISLSKGDVMSHM